MGRKAAEELIFGECVLVGVAGGSLVRGGCVCMGGKAAWLQARLCAPLHLLRPSPPPPLSHSYCPPGEDSVTSGATSDLRQATRMARHMVEDCGMSARIGPVAVGGGGEEMSSETRRTGGWVERGVIEGECVCVRGW